MTDQEKPSQARPDHLSGNVEGWQEKAEWYKEPAEKAWASNNPFWGLFAVPDTGIGLLPEDLTGQRCIELGCGAGYVSAWMARRGGSVVGIDPTPNQLETARRLCAQHELDIDFREGFGEATEFPDSSFDFAISEYGAALWADPYRWIPEASRILKPGGRLRFLTNSSLLTLCVPELDSDGPVRRELLRPYFGMYKINWPDAPGETEFHLTHGAWIELFRENGFMVERLVEVEVPPDAESDYEWVTADWASKWPIEDVWMLVKQ